jgi:hypothetical protein
MAKKPAKAKLLTVPTQKRTGPPSPLTEEVAEYVCEELSSGIPLAQIARTLNVSYRVLYKWAKAHPLLGDEIELSRDLGADVMALEILDISDGKIPLNVPDGEQLGWAKSRIETRLKLLASWNSRYAPGFQVRHANAKGDGDAPSSAPIKSEILATLKARLEGTAAPLVIEASPDDIDGG